jgi:hypothetical protein
MSMLQGQGVGSLRRRRESCARAGCPLVEPGAESEVAVDGARGDELRQEELYDLGRRECAARERAVPSDGASEGLRLRQLRRARRQLSAEEGGRHWGRETRGRARLSEPRALEVRHVDVRGPAGGEETVRERCREMRGADSGAPQCRSRIAARIAVRPPVQTLSPPKTRICSLAAPPDPPTLSASLFSWRNPPFRNFRTTWGAERRTSGGGLNRRRAENWGGRH